jgi:hypothetical protein
MLSLARLAETTRQQRAKTKAAITGGFLVCCGL